LGPQPAALSATWSPASGANHEDHEDTKTTKKILNLKVLSMASGDAIYDPLNAQRKSVLLRDQMKRPSFTRAS